jgi:hypothetical protein
LGRVMIGMDPHKRSATIEVIDERERVLDGGRFGTDQSGYQQMLLRGRQHPERIWLLRAATVSVGTSLNAWSPTAKPFLVLSA